MIARHAATPSLLARVVLCTMPRGLTSAQIENILYDDNVTELGDSDLSEEDDEDDSDYIQSDRGSDDENESESAPAHSSKKRKRDGFFPMVVYNTET